MASFEPKAFEKSKLLQHLNIIKPRKESLKLKSLPVETTLNIQQFKNTSQKSSKCSV